MDSYKCSLAGCHAHGAHCSMPTVVYGMQALQGNIEMRCVTGRQAAASAVEVHACTSRTCMQHWTVDSHAPTRSYKLVQVTSSKRFLHLQQSVNWHLNTCINDLMPVLCPWRMQKCCHQNFCKLQQQSWGMNSGSFTWL